MTRGGPGPQISSVSGFDNEEPDKESKDKAKNKASDQKHDDEEYPDVMHMVEVGNRMQRKARHQIEEKVKVAIEGMFGSGQDPAVAKKIHDAMALPPGVHEQTPELLAKRKQVMDSLTAEERASLDHSRLSPRTSQLATIAFAGFILILGVLIWFVTTCRSNHQ